MTNLLLLLFLLIPSEKAAQPIDFNFKEEVLYRAYYNLEHIRDKSKPKEIYKETMMLLAGENHSKFVSYDKIKAHNSNYEMIMAEINSGNSNIRAKAGRILTVDEFILSYQTNDILIDDYLGRHFMFQDEIEPITWELQDSVKTIAEKKCYLASTTYQGRTWFAWYNPEIAIPAGPWLLRGLPGLIMEAYDQTKDVKYAFQGMESGKAKNEVLQKRKGYEYIEIDPYWKPIKITKSEFLKRKSLALSDLKAFKIQYDNALVQSHGGGYDFALSNPISWNKVIPNPISLSK